MTNAYKTEVFWFRSYARSWLYLLSLHTGIEGVEFSSNLMAFAVVDDFGDLVIVKGWL